MYEYTITILQLVSEVHEVETKYRKSDFNISPSAMRIALSSRITASGRSVLITSKAGYAK
jgi:hypothetical protein